MSDKPDTIDTILDDMLNEGHTGPADALEWVQAKMKFYADRIKEAWKRQCSQSWHHREMEELILRHEKEVNELQRQQIGNAAAIRKALQTIHDRVNSLDEECGIDPVEIRDIARAALVSPPRNCDRFSDVVEADIAYREETGDVDENPIYWQLFANWLFTPVQEKVNDGKEGK